ncbi:MAG: exodeoxyribonuclease VII small subunit [Paludibacteraceae bacterium]|nr:exodeoxyribonuclease VII small subunit [Paludibacteraceae bacterium]
MKTEELTYDKAIARVQAIVQELEQTEALSVSEYKQKAKEAKQLLDYCEAQLRDMESALSDKGE